MPLRVRACGKLKHFRVRLRTAYLLNSTAREGRRYASLGNTEEDASEHTKQREHR